MIKDKIKSKDALKPILSALRKKGKRIVFTNGCFDLIHAGHVLYMEEAKGLGDILVVAANSDSSVRMIKGAGRPIVPLDERMKVLASMESVDFVTSFKEADPGLTVKELEPDIIAKGGDWKADEIVGGKDVKARGGKVVSIKFHKGLSTTSIVGKIKALK